MSNLAPEVDIAAEDALDIESFISRGNARDAGKDVPELEAKPVAEVVAEEVEKPEGEDRRASEPKPEDKPSVDRRTREGRKLSIQQEIDGLTTTKKNTEREVQAAEARLADLQRQATALDKKPTEPEKPVTQTEYKRYQLMAEAPKLAEFETYEDYSAALSLFIADKRFDERLEQHTARQAADTQKSAWFTKLNAAKEKDPTLTARLDPSTPASQYMSDYVMRSDIGVDILAYLSEHKPIAQRLSTLHPLLAAEELGRIEGTLKARQTAASAGPASAPVISHAKPLIKPVSGSPHVNDDDADDDAVSVDEHIRRENKKDPNINPAARR